MFCWDGPSCHERYTSSDYWMSSAPWAPQLAQYGIFSTAPNSSSWSGANRAYLKRVPRLARPPAPPPPRARSR